MGLLTSDQPLLTFRYASDNKKAPAACISNQHTLFWQPSGQPPDKLKFQAAHHTHPQSRQLACWLFLTYKKSSLQSVCLHTTKIHYVDLTNRQICGNQSLHLASVQRFHSRVLDTQKSVNTKTGTHLKSLQSKETPPNMPSVGYVCHDDRIFSFYFLS